MNANVRVNREYVRSYIKRSSLSGRNPVLVNLNKRLDSLYRKFLVNFRNTKSVAGYVHSRHILFRSEKLNRTVSRSVSLKSLKYFLRVVQNHCRRVKLKRRIRNYSRVVPALAFVIVHYEHMVCVILSETELAFVSRLLLWIGRFRDFDFH